MTTSNILGAIVPLIHQSNHTSTASGKAFIGFLISLHILALLFLLFVYYKSKARNKFGGLSWDEIESYGFLPYVAIFSCVFTDIIILMAYAGMAILKLF